MATFESTTEPVICCIGEDVAGRPTQFVLQRAFEAEGMHWQALTVEVLAEKLPLVIEATLAMGFRGLRFYGELERQASKILTEQGSLESFVGNVTSAVNIGESWQAWDNYGPAWLWLLEQENKPGEATSVWLHNDSLQTRSFFAALIAQADPSAWVWTNAPDEVSRLDHPQVHSAIASGRILFAPSPITDQLAQQLGCALGEATEQTESTPTRLVLVTSDESLSREMDSSLALWKVQLILPRHLKLASPLSDRVCRRLSEADISVAGKAYDFYRWTGKTVELALLRDAYDEYCDF